MSKLSYYLKAILLGILILAFLALLPHLFARADNLSNIKNIAFLDFTDERGQNYRVNSDEVFTLVQGVADTSDQTTSPSPSTSPKNATVSPLPSSSADTDLSLETPASEIPQPISSPSPFKSSLSEISENQPQATNQNPSQSKKTTSWLISSLLVFLALILVFAIARKKQKL